ncbi:MAG: ATP-binding cassette domain-containing protein, partial [Desemzia incerta]
MSQDTNRKKLLEVKNLKQYFNVGSKNEVKAIDDVSFDIYEGETFGLVGESGCGKTTTGRTIIRLYDPTDGEIYFDGTKVHSLHGRKDQLDFRKNMQMIFQDPYASLNPRMKVRDIIAEGIEIHKLANSEEEVTARVEELLELVGLNKDHSSRY